MHDSKPATTEQHHLQEAVRFLAIPNHAIEELTKADHLLRIAQQAQFFCVQSNEMPRRVQRSSLTSGVCITIRPLESQTEFAV